MNPNDSPRFNIQSPNQFLEILSTETGDGTWMPNTWLTDEVREAIREFEDRSLRDLLDPTSDAFGYFGAREHASRLVATLRQFQDACLTHPLEIIRVLARDPAIIVSDELGAKLGIDPGRRMLSNFQTEIAAISNRPNTDNI